MVSATSIQLLVLPSLPRTQNELVRFDKLAARFVSDIVQNLCQREEAAAQSLANRANFFLPLEKRKNEMGFCVKNRETTESFSTRKIWI